MADGLHVRDFVGKLGWTDEALCADFERTKRFLEGFFKSTPDGHGFSHGLHRRSQSGVGTDEFFKSETWDLCHYVVDGRLKAGRGLTCDIVLQLIKAVADCKFCCDLCYGETSRLRGQCGATRDARVHLDHDHAAIGWIDGKLNIGATSFDTNFANAGKRSIAHKLVFFVS